MTVVDKATRMNHLIACSKTVTAAQTAQLYMREVAKIHGISSIIYIDRDAQFTSKFRKELRGLFGTQFRFNTAGHPQTQGNVERMNAVIGNEIALGIISNE